MFVGVLIIQIALESCLIMWTFFILSILCIKELAVSCTYYVPCTVIGSEDKISQDPDGLELIFWRKGGEGRQIINK